MDKLFQKANTLIEALPYIQRFVGKTFVVKYGGHAMNDNNLKEQVLQDIALLKFVGVNLIVVHGGGPAINEMLQKFNVESRFLDGLRVTDEITMQIVEMVLSGQINKELVSIVNKYIGKGVGISGKDGSLIQAIPLDPKLGHVGQIKEIDPTLIQTLLSQGYLPIVAPIGAGEEGESYNINADTVASELAIALKAHKLIFLTEIDGIYEDKDDPTTRCSQLNTDQLQAMIGSGQIVDGMIPKVKGCIKALKDGVKQVHILDGRLSHSLLLEIFTDQGIGTMMVNE
ncbi:MAG: acetylglutamate kinase [Halanaerobiales bacterium]|nr:acetylglutamate kinase [Halanaerobiales bacterium]